MCLDIDRNQSPKVAEEDITCYKFLRVVRDGTYYAPYYSNHQYEIGKEYTSILSRYHDNGADGCRHPFTGIRQGLHSLATVEDTRCIAMHRTEVYKGFHKYVVVECVIPKGATYYKGYWRGCAAYASNKLKAIKVIESIVPEEK